MKAVKKSVVRWSLWLLAGLSAGCSSVVPVSYYQLATADTVPVAAPAAGKTLYIEPVQVASYLNSNALILQTSAVQLHKSSQHQWAEALDLQLQRSLVNSLSQQLPQWRVNSVAATVDSCRLLLQLDKFHGEQSGQVQIAGRYHLLCAAQVTTKSFASTLAQQDAGYPAMVAALSQLWQQQIGDIAALINKSAAN